MMAEQKAKTKEYWDTFYSELPTGDEVNQFVTESSTMTNNTNGNETSDLEWIAPNSPQLIDTILSLFPALDDSESDSKDPNQTTEKRCDSKVAHILEIGCGISQLSLSLLQRLLLKNQEAADRVHMRAYDFVSTDVSSVCIEQNRIRDDAFIASIHATDGSLSYELLDVLTQKSSSRTYDVILDKGTLDTFLFRSKRTKKGSDSHPPLLTPLLNNLHGWLRSGCKAKYIIISPRSKIRSVRDFRGFTSVRRIKFDVSSLGCDSVLVKSNNEKAARSTSEIYLYECTKNEHYNPENDAPYSSCRCSIEDESICTKCGIRFKDFRGKADAYHQGEAVWARRWKNHYKHCKQR